MYQEFGQKYPASDHVEEDKHVSPDTTSYQALQLLACPVGVGSSGPVVIAVIDPEEDVDDDVVDVAELAMTVPVPTQ
jgi:hypothetical protein